jgi:hypothetical protein
LNSLELFYKSCKFELLFFQAQPRYKFFWCVNILTNHFKQPKLVWICMIPTKTAVLGVNGFESYRPLVVKLILSNWDETQTWFYWLPAHRASPGTLAACWKNNRLKKSVVQIITKNSHQKWLVKMVTHQNWLGHQKKIPIGKLRNLWIWKTLNSDCSKISSVHYPCKIFFGQQFSFFSIIWVIFCQKVRKFLDFEKSGSKKLNSINENFALGLK